MKLLTTLLILSACAVQDSHPLHMERVSNFVTPIEAENLTALKGWIGVLDRQPITNGNNKPTYEVMKQINDDCNKKAYKLTPAWPTAKEFAMSSTADCKGFAICKYYALRKAGFSANQLNLWSGDYTHKAHLMLTAGVNNKQYALDIGAESDLPEAKDYFYKNFWPTYRFNEVGWTVN